jgi:hypothetical protein
MYNLIQLTLSFLIVIGGTFVLVGYVKVLWAFLPLIAIGANMELLKKLLRTQIRDRLPSRLPQGASEFNEFTESLFRDYNLPSNNSFKHAVATSIMQLGQTIDSRPRRYFVAVIRKAMANQVAYAQIELIRKEEKEANENKDKETNE